MLDGAPAESGNTHKNRLQFRTAKPLEVRLKGRTHQQVPRQTLHFDQGLQQLSGHGGTGAATARPGIYGELGGFHEKNFQPIQFRIAETATQTTPGLTCDGFINPTESLKEFRRTTLNGFKELASWSYSVEAVELLRAAETQFLGRVLESGNLGKQFLVTTIHEITGYARRDA